MKKIVLPTSQVLVGQLVTLKAIIIHCSKKEKKVRIAIYCVKILEMVGKQLISRNNHRITCGLSWKRPERSSSYNSPAMNRGTFHKTRFLRALSAIDKSLP